ncbi:MAG TPA: hypothetical protein VF796_23860 [Humisphaera sp.]
MKRTPILAALAALALLVAAPLARAQAADPVAAYARQSTNVIVVLDLAQLDLDKLVAYGVDKAKANGVQQADIDKGLGEIKPQLDQAKGFINAFKDAGATKVYALINAEGVMGGDFGALVIPASSPENAKKISDLIGQLMQQAGGGEGGPKAQIQGSTVVVASPAGLAGQPAANPKLTAALAAGAAQPATLRVVVDGAFLAKATADQANMTAEDKQLVQNTDTITMTANVPPQSMMSMSVTAKDAATAQKMADKYKAELDKGRNDPQAKAEMGADLTEKLYAALAPKVTGSTVGVTLDTQTIEQVIVPAIAKAAAAEQKKNQQGNTAPKPEGLK